MKRYIIILILCFASSLYSQEIKGVVTNAKEQPIESVSIGSLNLVKPIGTSTNQKGEYSLSLQAGKEYSLRFSCIGYKDFDTTLILKNFQTTILNVTLMAESTTLQGVEVKGDYSRQEGITRISSDWAKNTAGPNGGVENVIKTIEGVSSNNELSSQYSVRGGNFDENLVYVNDIEIFRPVLVRSGQQEGLSFINPDMISDIQFSSGGFAAEYGDKMSSVLDIKYRKPVEFSGNLSIGLLGGGVYLADKIKDKFTYQFSYRNKTTKYLLNSLETQGDYNTTFHDFQTYLTWDINEKLDLSFVGNIADNTYEFIPQNRETDFGDINNPLKFKVYFDGKEKDKFSSMFGALKLNYKLKPDLHLKFITSAYSTNEKETYDIQGQYWLSQAAGLTSEEDYDLGIGTYIEHARNNLRLSLFNFEHKGEKYYANGVLSWGIKYQREVTSDKLNEWKMVDSADYSIPSNRDEIGIYNPPEAPNLQDWYHSKNDINSNRLTLFVQRHLSWQKEKGTYFLNLGARGQYWDFNKEFFPSPRVSLAYKPKIKQDILFRFASGIYVQYPFYREYRNLIGEINSEVKSQKSLHFVLSSDWNFKIRTRNFKLTSSLYYKHLWDLIPYYIDNLRLRYTAENNAKGYATGMDIKLFGEFIKGIDSWLTLSLMQTKQDIDGDGKGYVARPTDQLVNVSVSFQDYLPSMPWMRVYLNFNYGSGYPFFVPNTNIELYRPNYMRADLAFTFRIKEEEASWAKKNFLKALKRIWLNVEWLNVFNNKNIVAYTYIKDNNNIVYPVPNYLTPSLLNAKITVEF
ncbi:MAG: carboxypeptidase-like regulatory domain-containing protein [Bacteroidota bacterium]|nr:carboxypeptidase-like regulatory domain-containing protein [Bacteroidota bacterium]